MAASSPTRVSGRGASTGWTNNVVKLLEFISRRGEVAIAGRKSGEQLWDLARRVYPEVPILPFKEAQGAEPAAPRRPGIAREQTMELAVEPAYVFGFEYHLEMYKPAASRRRGYFALPVPFGDRFVGKLDAKADRKPGVLVVNAVHQDEPFTGGMTVAINEEIAGPAAWLKLDLRRNV